MKHKLLFILSVISTSLIGASYTWNGSTSTAWNLNANWTPSTGFPVAGDNVTIVTAANLPTLDATRTISSITMTSGTLNLNGFTLTTNGTSNFNGGTINNGTINPTGTNTTFNGTTFGAIVTAVSNNIWVSNSTFNNTASFTQTGSSDTYSGAGNTFNADVTFSNTGSASFNYGWYAGSTNNYNGNIYVNNTGGGNMTLAYDAPSVLAASKTIIIGGLGVTNGGITIGNFSQAAANPLTLNLASGTAYISMYKGNWTGTVNITAPRVYVQYATFNNTASFTQTGNSDTYMSGGNTYNADVTFTNTGPASFNYGWYAGSTNTYNGNIYVNNTGGGNMTLGYDSPGILAATKTILIGGSGVTNGGILIGSFTQADATPLSINLSSGTGYISMYKGTWTGTVSITAPRVYVQQATFNNTASFTQTGNSDTYMSGGNTYNADVTFSNTGPASFNYGWYAGSTNTYNGNIYVNNTGGGTMTLGYDAPSVLAATKTIFIGGLGVTNGGVLIGSFTQADATPLSINLASGTGYISMYKGTWTGTVSITAPRMYVQQVTFNNTASFTQTGNSDTYMSGGNTYNADVTFSNTGPASFNYGWYAGSTNTYNGNIYVNNTGGGTMTLGYDAPSVLAATKTIFIGGLGVTNGGVLIGSFTQADATPLSINLASGTAYISIYKGTWTGTVSITAPRIFSQRVTYNNAATFTKTGNFDDYMSGGNTFNGVATFNIQNNSSWYWNHYNAGATAFNNNLVFTSTGNGGIYFGWNETTGCTSTLAAGRTISIGGAGFNTGTLGLGQFLQADATTLNITLGTSARIISNRSIWTGAINFTAGGVNIERTTCNNTATFTKTGSFDDYFSSGNTFNGVTTFNMQGTANWFWNHYNAGASTFNQNIVVTNTSTGGIYFGWNETTGCTTTLAAGRIISVGGAGFNTGTLGLGQFLQADATTLTVTLGTGARIISNRSVWTGIINFTAGGVNIERTTCNNTATFTKTGSFDDYFSSGNTFNGVTTFNMQGTANWFWNHYNAGASTFNQNIVVTNTSTGGIYFGWNETTGCTTTLAAGRTISVGGAGFNTGTLGLGQFLQADATTLNVTLGTGANIISNRSVWTGIINITAGGIGVERTTCNNTANFTKTGSFDNYNSSGNTFNGNTSINMQGTGNWFWNHYNAGVSTFNQDVAFTNTSTGGIYFGWNENVSTVLASGRIMSVGGAGFTSGTLGLGRISQTGSTGFNLTLGGTSHISIHRSTFGGNITFSCGAGVYLEQNTFNGNMVFAKTSSGTVNSNSENTFNGTVTYNHSGSNDWILNNWGTSDTYNDNVTFVKTGTGNLFPAYNSINYFKKNISTTGSTGLVYFAWGSGNCIINGNTTQTITGGSNTTIFRVLTVNNTDATGININAPVIINNSITMTDGIINTSGTNYLVINDNATVSGFSTACYVSGPMKKIGNDAFIFPVGRNNYLARLTMTPSSGYDVTTEFTCEYTEAAAPNNNNPAFKGSNIDHVSGIEYWDLSRVLDPGNNATCNVTLYWESETRSGITNMADLCVAHLSSSTGKWENQGGTGVDLGVNGYVTSTVALSNFSPLTFGSRNNVNPLPIQLLSFKATLNSKKEVDLNWLTATETNNNFFTIERSVNGINFEALETINSKAINGYSNSMLNYATIDKKPITGISYYRLKQTDYDNTSTYSNIETVAISAIANFSLYPNPASKEQLPMLSITPKNNQSILVVVIDATGKEVYSKIVILEKEVNQVIALDPEGKLAAGFYSIRATSDNTIFNTNLIIR